MAATMIDPAAEAIIHAAHPVTGDADDYDGLLDLVDDRRFVLIGEASHGTHEFYRERARITRRLIQERGFTAVAVEGDWPDAYRVNRYVMGLSSDRDANAALSDFRRFPAWMWRNHDVLNFVEWLRARNDAHVHPATKAALLRTRPLQPCGIDRSRDRIPRARRPRRSAARTRTLRLPRPPRTRRAGVQRRGCVPVRTSVRERGGGAARRASAPGRRVLAARWMGGRRRAVLHRSERARRSGRRGVLPEAVLRRRRGVEPPRPAHGRDARCARRASRPPTPSHEGCRLGAQLARR